MKLWLSEQALRLELHQETSHILTGIQVGWTDNGEEMLTGGQNLSG